MNKCFLMGRIIEISDYKFFYNSKAHDSEIDLKIEIKKDKNTEIINLKAYDNIADHIYRCYQKGDEALIEGELRFNMQVEILNIDNLVKNKKRKIN